MSVNSISHVAVALLWNIFWLNVETVEVRQSYYDAENLQIYSRKSVLHMQLTSCVRQDCFIEYSYCLFMITCEWKYNVECIEHQLIIIFNQCSLVQSLESFIDVKLYSVNQSVTCVGLQGEECIILMASIELKSTQRINNSAPSSIEPYIKQSAMDQSINQPISQALDQQTLSLIRSIAGSVSQLEDK